MNFSNKFNWNRVILSLTYLVQAGAQFGVSYADNAMIKLTLGNAELGNYSKELKVAFVFNTLMTVFISYFSPYIVENRRKKDVITLIEKYLIVFVILSGIFFISFGDNIYTIIYNEKVQFLKEGVISNVAFLSMGSMLFGLYMIRIVYNRILESKRINLIVTMISVVFNICLNYILLQYYGRYGAGISTMLTYLLMLMISSLFILKYRQNAFSAN